MEISLCMIVKNESMVLERCLKSFSVVADEIIIVDTGSTDGTVEIAKNYTDKVYHFEWIDDFSAARNYSYSFATKDYIMWCDADDILTEDNAAKLLELKRTLSPDIDAVMLRYVVSTDEFGAPKMSFFRERITRRDKKFIWHEPVHEYLAYSGRRETAEISILHKRQEKEERKERNIKIYEKQKRLSSRGIYYYARELYYLGRYRESIKMFNKFLLRKDAWIEDRINTYLHLGRCYFALAKYDEAVKSLVSGFAVAIPRAEHVCLIGESYFRRNRFEEALFWFRFAATIEIPSSTLGFLEQDYYNFIPNIMCAVMCDKLGRYKEGNDYNELAAKFKPEHESVRKNREYFATKISDIS
ncbi:MAG: glycosyltransferase [Christensenellaceae bacterium]|jgi:glycosyltransferase involved in cell wall biosynthesis|nr:glycosyltransferase [Christensenellaceae bacterium]